MKNLIHAFLRLLILICVLVGGFVVYQSWQGRNRQQAEFRNEKAITLKKFLLGYNKPSRVEIFSYTKRYANDVEEIKKMNVPLDAQSTFYITIQFFTDENDPTAPLVAQVRFMDLKTDNMVKEESINL
jgi:hypothetical protein